MTVLERPPCADPSCPGPFRHDDIRGTSGADGGPAAPSAPASAPGRVTAPQERPARPYRRLGYGLIGCGVLLLPWLFVLAAGLPATATASRWAAAWVGLDALEAVGLITTGLLHVRRDHRRALPAAATAMLLVDAWFDTMTAAPGADLVTAVAMALGAELPLAALCATLAWRGTSRPRGSRSRPRRTEEL